VTGSEYDLDPRRIEHQARMIVHTPELLRIARRLADIASAVPEDLPEDARQLASRCASILRHVYQSEEDAVAAAAE
jgi:ribosomal protein S19E (S16A)